MKCPCCGGEVTDRDYIIVGGELYIVATGQRFRGPPDVLKILNTMLNTGSFTPRDRAVFTNTDFVQVSRLREFLRDTKLPFRIPNASKSKRGKATYYLEPLHVENNNTSQHPQNVHPGRGLHDL